MPGKSITILEELVPKGPRVQIFIQNLGPDDLFIRWDGKDTVIAAGDDANSGVKIEAGSHLELFDSYIKERTGDKAIWAISAGTSDVRYVIG